MRLKQKKKYLKYTQKQKVQTPVLVTGERGRKRAWVGWGVLEGMVGG